MKEELDLTIPIDIGWHMNMAWINFQKKGEYNPPHNHPCDLSFVTFLQVPKEIGLEFESIPDIERGKGPGVLYLDYGEQLPFSVKSFGKLPEKGDLFIFPGWLMHHVHDFKADVERISVSGNVMFDIKIKDRNTYGSQFINWDPLPILIEIQKNINRINNKICLTKI